MIGAEGVIATLPPKVNDEEFDKLQRSAMIVRKAIDELA
jgi:malate/lactate dehydrogenase